jgi:hypothetical protein
MFDCKGVPDYYNIIKRNLLSIRFEMFVSHNFCPKFLGAKSTSIRDCVGWLVGRSVGWSVGPLVRLSPRCNYVEN